jgi:hypothetical protein
MPKGVTVQVRPAAPSKKQNIYAISGGLEHEPAALRWRVSARDARERRARCLGGGGA